MPDMPFNEGELVMTEAEFDFAQAKFMQTIKAQGWPGMDRDGFIIYIVMSYAANYASTHPYGIEATRLLVHFLHLRAGQKTIDPAIIENARDRVAVYEMDEDESDGEPDYGPEFI